ncbi:MAG: Hsp20/alpha crystallin family protein [Magnetococcales bacterium]|nr:Hsp20/alpha crystallin family protein [Magnetococcales bacterium]
MMSVAIYDPFRSVRALQNEINRVFDQDWQETNVASHWSMRVDIKEAGDALVLKADLPGMTLEDIRVNVEDGRLTISGERQFEKDEKKEDYHRVECTYGQFSRSFQIPAYTDVTGISADYKNGVLTITLPKREDAKPRQVEVKING